MFFRRVFNHKKDTYPSPNPHHHPDDNGNVSDNTSDASSDVRIYSSADKVRQSHRNYERVTKNNRMFNVIQLTPLWEHVIRTGHLPDSINIPELFDEFSERLNDPEWQVRQHALRVLVDVLIILGPRADSYFAGPLVATLVDNLCHAAPAVRKGALDTLRVYIGESRLPENVLCDIIDLGINRGSDSIYGSRLTVGVMLCLPALIQVTLTHPKRRLLVRTAVNALLSKIGEISYQEVVLKILLSIKKIVGESEFYDCIPVNSQHDFNVLCDVYGLNKKDMASDRSSLNSQRDSGITLSLPSSSESGQSWTKTPDVAINKILQGSNRPATVSVVSDARNNPEVDTEIRWKISKSCEETSSNATPRTGTPCSLRNESRASSILDSSPNCPLTHVPEDELPPGKVIMETEIRLNKETAVTMRILEADSSNDQDIVSEEETIIPLATSSFTETTSTESMKTSQAPSYDGFDDNLDLNRRSTPKRVHFGGEIIKIRTPDSESVAQSDVDDHIRPITHPVFPQSPLRARGATTTSSPQRSQIFVNDAVNSKASSTTSLSIEIPQDNTQPLVVLRDRPKTAAPILHAVTSPVAIISFSTSSASAGGNRIKSASPHHHRRRLSLGSRLDAMAIVSPQGLHTPMEMLYNLQRSPLVSPVKGSSSVMVVGEGEGGGEAQADTKQIHQLQQTLNDSVTAVQVYRDLKSEKLDKGTSNRSWEDLEIVTWDVARNIKSGDCTIRSAAFCQLEKALMNPDNFSAVQPCLDSLLRTLLSSEKHCEVAYDKKRILINTISRLPLETIETRTNQILVGSCRQGGPNANQIARAMMQRMPAAAVVTKLLSEEFLHARSSRFRENALQIVLYALMKFPSTYFDVSSCVARTVQAALDTKKRVRQAALDVLAVLGQISSPKIVLDVTQDIAATRDVDGDKLCAAVKARLSRKQLPMIRADDSVQYGLRLPNSHNFSVFGADIEWITSGIGSVSSKSLKARVFQASPLSMGGGSSSATTTESELDSPKGANTFIPALPHGQLKFGNRGQETSTGFHSASSSSFPNPYGHDGAITAAIGFNNNNNNRDSGGVQARCNKRSRFVDQEDAADSDGNHKLEMLVGSSIPLHRRENAGRESKEENTLWGQQQQQRQSFPELKGDGNTISRVLVGNSSGAATLRKGPHSAKENTENCGGGREGQGTPPSARIHDNNKSNVSRLPSMETTSFGEKIIGDQGYEFLNGSDDEEEEEEQQKSSSAERFISSATQSSQLVDKTGSQETLSRERLSRESDCPGAIPQSVHTNDHISILDYERKPKGILVSKSAGTNRNLTTTTDMNNNQEDVKVSTPMAAAMKSAYCYKRSLHHFGQSSRSSSNSEDVAFGVVHDSNEKYNSEETQELTSELSTTSTSTGSSHSSTNGQSENASAASIANRLNKLENYTEVEVKGLSRTRSVQTLPQINASDSRHYPEARPKTSISLNASIPFDEIPIKTRYSSTVSLAQANSRSSPCFDQVDHLSSVEQTPSPFETPFSQSVAANLDQPEPLRPFQRNATEFIKSPKNFLKRGNRKIFPVTKLSTVISHPPVSRVSPKKAAAPVKYKDYTSPVLAHFERPREAYLNCMSQLEDSNWETVMVGLNNFRRLIRHHPEYIDAHIHVVAGILAKHVRNLRSQVSRAACQATEEFFFTHRKQLETEADDLVTTLLHRTADTNKFLRKDATKALESMCDNLTTQKVIHLLSTRGVTHQNALVRTKTSELLSRLVVNLTADKVYAMNKDSRDRIFLTGAQLLNEGSLETRNHAKQMFRELSTHLKYQKVLLEVIPQKLYRQIEKALKKVEN